MLLNKRLFNLNLIKINNLKYINNSSYNYDSNNLNNQDKLNENQLIDKSKIHPFKRLYPWTNLTEFVDNLEQRIVYKDKNIIAIDKPFGVAFHKPNKTLHKPYSFESLSLLNGEPKYCIVDAIPDLEERLNCSKLELVKTIDRYSSGIMLLSTHKSAKQWIQKSIRRNKRNRELFYNFLCISQGFPAIQGDELSELVRIKLTDLDELCDYREPILIEPKLNRKLIDKGYLSRVNLKIKSINKLNSSSYLQVSTNQTRWNFVRCYIANKTAFVLGDLRFSANVKRILGETVIETTNNFYKNNRIEPVNKEILNALKVRTNRQIPLMLHLESILLKNFIKRGDILIKTKQLPDHFQFAIDKLNLCK